uniref:C-type lectin domain-containing protein n=1 Tax=Sinocyclocheilus grahami TaxID=75366 RepID=A0A672KFA0_SINGR
MRELEELKTNYTRVKESLSLCVRELAFLITFFILFFTLSIYLITIGLICVCKYVTSYMDNHSGPCHGKLYLFNSDKMNWSSSRASCVSKGADLVTITSQTEQDFLVSKIKQTQWIGLSDLETEGHWVWVNNQTLNETGVQFWFSEGPTEPDNWKKQDPSGEDCASLGDSNGNFQSWFDASCKKKKKFICEKKLLSTSIFGNN